HVSSYAPLFLSSAVLHLLLLSFPTRRSSDLVRHVLGSDEFDDAARADVRKAESLGITAVPTYLFAQKYVLPGAQTVETFSDALQQGWEEFSHACRTDGCS